MKVLIRDSETRELVAEYGNCDTIPLKDDSILIVSPSKQNKIIASVIERLFDLEGKRVILYCSIHKTK